MKLSDIFRNAIELSGARAQAGGRLWGYRGIEVGEIAGASSPAHPDAWLRDLKLGSGGVQATW